LHRDTEKFAERLIEVVKAQGRPNFRRTQLKSQRNSSRINVVERDLDTRPELNVGPRSPVAKPETKNSRTMKFQPLMLGRAKSDGKGAVRPLFPPRSVALSLFWRVILAGARRTIHPAS
jgi:hypothetical protein